ncbi:membrane associated guanylate kinase, WW and PDZ domain containing protein magi [Musca autumnalis]|uniref:membrane associated guanylate kinase, WW and PDZ domain containing protein magi n=1 Tax=Musca autumnalis TaxID=221902 RepID=UPI003CE96A47
MSSTLAVRNSPLNATAATVNAAIAGNNNNNTNSNIDVSKTAIQQNNHSNQFETSPAVITPVGSATARHTNTLLQTQQQQQQQYQTNNMMNAISGTFAGNNMNATTSTPPSSASPAVTNSQPPEDFYTTVQKHPQQKQQQQQQQQSEHNNYYQPPPAVSYSHQQPQQHMHQQPSYNSHPTSATSLATFNGNSNLETATVANGGHSSNNNNMANNSNYNNGNSNLQPPLPTLTNKPPVGNSSHHSATTPTTTSSSSSPVVMNAMGKTDATISSSSSSNSLLSGPVLTSAFAKKQQQQQLHASREDVTNVGGGCGGAPGGANSQSSPSSLMNANNNNQYQQQQQHHPHQPHLQHHHPHQHNHNSNSQQPPPTSTMANGIGNINSNSSNSQHNLNSILKGSKENLLQNSYSNGSISGSTTGSETGGGGTGTNSSSHIEQDDPGDGLGPLPPKWETAYTERGELYFIDHNTGTSHWLDPRLSKFQKKSLEECTEGELPYGWEKIEDSLYGTYYIDHVNRKTQYENPVLEAKRRAAEQKQNQQQQQQQSAQAQAQQQQQHQQSLQRPQTPSSSSVLNGTGASIGLSSVSSASTLSTVDISQRAMQPPPPMMTHPESNKGMLPYKFTRNPAEMQGERITTTLLKSARGLGITIVGGDGDGVEEFLQIKSIVPNGPAWLDGQLQMGDVLVYVNDTCVLGFSHHEMVNIFQSIMVGDTVTLEVCRGYPLPFDPNDPNTEVVTTIAVDGLSNEPEKQRRMLMDLNMDGNYNFLDISAASSNGGGGGTKHNLSTSSSSGGGGGTLDNSGFILMKKPEVHTFSIIKGAMGFGFTIADSSYGQKVKKILDRSCCRELQEGDILLEINDHMVRNKSHQDVVQILKDCSKTEPTIVKIQRPVNSVSGTSPNGNGSVGKLRKNFLGGTTSIGNNALFRSKTPTADLYSTMQKEILPIRPKTPLVDTRRARVKTPNMELSEDNEVAAVNNKSNDSDSMERSLAESKSHLTEGSKSQNSLSELDAINHDIPPFMDPYPKMVTSLSERLASVTMQNDNGLGGGHSGGVPSTGYLRTTASGVANYENQSDYVSGGSGNYSSIYGLSQMPPTMSPLSGALYGASAGVSPGGGLMAPAPNNYHHHHESCFCYDCQDYRNGRLNQLHAGHPQAQQPSPRGYYPPNSYNSGQAHPAQYSPASSASLQAAHIQNERMQKRVNELLNDRRRVGFSPLEQQHHHPHSAGVAGYSPSSSTQSQHLAHNSSIMGHHGQQTALNSWGNNHPGGGYNILQPAATDIMHHNGGGGGGGYPISSDIIDCSGEQSVLSEVTLQRQALGFGFRIVGGTEEGSQVTVGHIVPGGAADNDHRITTGDEILSIDGINVVNASHHKVVSLMGEAALRGQVTMILRRRTAAARPPQQHHTTILGHQQQQHQHSMVPPHQMPPMMFQQPMMHQDLQQHQQQALPLHLRNHPAAPLRYPYDVIVTRHENEGFGFVIISSSNQYYGSTIGKLIPGSPADRCGELKVGDRIIAVNRIDIAGMSHGDVVNLIKESGLHVRLTIGCPKEGAIINAAPTMPAGSSNPAGGLLINSAQASPGQVSQTPPGTAALQVAANTDNNITPYFERPLLSAGSNNGSAASSSTHMSAQQSPNTLPPQL